MAQNQRTYYLRPMPKEIAGKYFCSGTSYSVLCCSKAIYYLVGKPPRGRSSLYRRCAECAREDAIGLGIAMPKGGA
jgi:hypothetical protein